MVSIGRITGRTVAKNRDGEKNVLILQVEITDPDDVQEVELFRQAGEDYNPPNDSRVIIADLGPAWRVGIAVDDGIEPSMGEGERKIYSIDSGAIKAFINLLADGVIEINGNTDFAARFNELKSGFDELRDDFNGHVHKYNPGPGSLAPSEAPTVPSVASIDAAKIDEIKVP